MVCPARHEACALRQVPAGCRAAGHHYGRMLRVDRPQRRGVGWPRTWHSVERSRTTERQETRLSAGSRPYPRPGPGGRDRRAAPRIAPMDPRPVRRRTPRPARGGRQSATSVDGGAGVERERLRVGRAVGPQVDPYQAGQAPDRLAEGVERRPRRGRTPGARPAPERPLVNGRSPRPAPRRRASRRGTPASRCPRARPPRDGAQLGGIGVRPGAVDDRVGRAEDAQQRAATAPVLRGARDEPGDLYELDEHAADPGQRRHRPERRERVVARLDLDLREGLEQRRLADVRRPHQRDLRGTLAPDRDRIAVDRVRADARVLDLGEE